MKHTEEQPLVYLDHALTEPERLGADPQKFKFDLSRGILSICLVMPDGTDLWWCDVIKQREYGPSENMRAAAIRFLEDPIFARELREAVKANGARGFTFYVRPLPYRVGPHAR
jgi:hypothetical protein